MSAWPTASAIEYGQTLASSTLTDGTTFVVGSFAFTSPGTAPDAGTATQSVTFTPEDEFYGPESGGVSVLVNPVAQSITFDSLPVMLYGDAPFALTASASSGLPVSYASADTSVATVSGSTVTILKLGSTLLTASQSGTENHMAATPVSQTLVVEELQMGMSLHMETNAALLTITGNPGREYAIHYTDALTNANWPVLITLTNLPSSPYEHSDPLQELPSSRFYRIRYPAWEQE